MAFICQKLEIPSLKSREMADIKRGRPAIDITISLGAETTYQYNQKMYLL